MGIESYPADDLENPSKKTILQITNIIELYYKHFNDYEAEIISWPFKMKLSRVFWKLYGTEWEKLNNCTKI